MQHIPSLFVKDVDGLATREVRRECRWVQRGEGVATRLWDGEPVLLRAGGVFRLRRDVEPREWVPVPDGPGGDEYRAAVPTARRGDGTYELVRPDGNEVGFSAPFLVPHGRVWLNTPRDFDGLRAFLDANEYEGIVWWHADGRMAKVKRVHFGLPRLNPDWRPR